jgi:hypothetical protein
MLRRTSSAGAKHSPKRLLIRTQKSPRPFQDPAYSFVLIQQVRKYSRPILNPPPSAGPAHHRVFAVHQDWGRGHHADVSIRSLPFGACPESGCKLR